MKATQFIASGLLAISLAAPMAQAAIYVDPTGATESNYDPNRPAADTINGAGLSDATLVATGESTTNALPTHNTDSGDMWRTASGYDWAGAGGAVVTYTLGAAYNLTGMHVWNYNEYWTASQAQRGVKNVKIEYQAGDTNWVTYTENMELAEASALSSYAGTNYTFSSTLAGVTAVRFTCLTNWAENTTDRIGLSEVRFIAETPQYPLAPVTKKLWINGTTARLFWDVGAGSTNYMLKRSETSGTNYVTVANVAATNNAMEFTDSNLVAGTTYYYVIVGENAYGEGPASSELSGTAQDFSIIWDENTLEPYGSWGNSIYTMYYAVFDGDTSTYYDSKDANGWAGIDLGAGNERACPAIDFYPRSTHVSRMDGVVFQGSNDGSTWDGIITNGTAVSGWNRIYTDNTNAYRYFRYYKPNSYGNAAEVKFLTTNDVDDVFFLHAPADGATDVPVDGGIAITATDVLVDFNSLISSYQMLINSNVVSASKSSSGGITTFNYTTTLAYETDYTVQLNVYRTDGVTNTVEFSFTTVPDYNSGDFLIAPGVRNGGFEYVNGAVSNTTKVTDFAQIDNWVKVAGNGKAGTVYDPSSPEGVRYLDTDRYFETYNLTDHVIAQGDRFDFSFTMFGRPAGVIVGLCYSNAVDGVTNIAASEVTVPDSSSIYHEWTGSYTFAPGDPAIGSTLGLMIQENGNSPTNDTSTTEAHIDRVWLRFGTGPSTNPVIHLLGTGGANVSLMWNSEAGVTYYIRSKASLVSGSWMTNGIVVGDGSTISTNVPMGGSSAQFFSLEAQ